MTELREGKAARAGVSSSNPQTRGVTGRSCTAVTSFGAHRFLFELGHVLSKSKNIRKKRSWVQLRALPRLGMRRAPPRRQAAMST